MTGSNQGSSGTPDRILHPFFLSLVAFYFRVGAALSAQVEAPTKGRGENRDDDADSHEDGDRDDGAGGERLQHHACLDMLAGSDLEAFLVALGESVGLSRLVEPVRDAQAISARRQIGLRPGRVRGLGDRLLDAALQPNESDDDPGNGGFGVAGLFHHDYVERSGRGFGGSRFRAGDTDRNASVEEHRSESRQNENGPPGLWSKASHVNLPVLSPEPLCLER